MDGIKLRYVVLEKSGERLDQNGETLIDYKITDKRFYNKRKLFEFLKDKPNHSWVREYY